MIRHFLFVMAVLTLSCDQKNQDAKEDAGLPGSADEEDALPEIGPTAAIPDAVYTWLLRASLLFKKETVFTIDYYEGYNLNFEITEEQARSLLPENLTPVPLKLLESDPEPLFYLSWYLAAMGSGMTAQAINRIDLFTYARDQNGELSLFFISSVMEIPAVVASNKTAEGTYKEIFEFFARDSETGEAAYPHYYTNTFLADHDTFKVVYGDSSIEATACPPLTENERFSRDFVMANSQIYRNAVDKNVNYFNQSFMDAKVETRDPGCITVQKLEGFHPMLKDLRSIHFYGSKDKKVTWYFEM